MPTTLPTQFLASIAALKFSNSTELSNYFISKTGKDFIEWFNASCALKENWTGIKMTSDADAHTRFSALWNQVPVLFGTPSINLLQFIALMSIVNNETGGSIKPVTERVGNISNPGLAYAFNRISGIKRSYNTLSTNKTAFDLFRDPYYKQQHGSLPLASALKDTPNLAWKGEVYPTGMATSTDPLITGFIQEADFYKFRGRGFIQTTTRGNYRALIAFVQGYNGNNGILKQYQSQWKGKDADLVATVSTNKDWDLLFQSTDLIIPSFAISIHNRAAGNYLAKIVPAPGAEASIRAMGKAISGSDNYAELFLRRVVQVAGGLG